MLIPATTPELVNVTKLTVTALFCFNKVTVIAEDSLGANVPSPL